MLHPAPGAATCAFTLRSFGAGEHHAVRQILDAMSEPDSQTLSGLFDLAAPGVGRDLKRTFFEADLNDSARGLVAYLDKLFSIAAEPGWVFLTTVENDAIAGEVSGGPTKLL